MASEFVNAYLKKREEEKQTGTAPGAGGRTPFAQEYLKQRYAGGTVPTVQREDASDVYFDFATGKSYSASARAAERARQAALISPASMRGALNRASSMQAEADRYKGTLLREPESGVLMPDYDAIVAANNSQNSLSLAARSRALAQKALADYEKQYRTLLDSYGPYMDGSGKDVAGQYNARKKAVDDANQAYEDAFADYQKKQQAADYARRQDDKRKALQAEAASYRQMTAQKESAEQAAQDAWSEYYAMIPRAADYRSNQKNAYSRSSYADRMDKITSNKYSEEDQIRDLVMTDEELAIMTYLRNTQGEDAAQRYYNSLGLNERLKEHWENAFFEYGDENPVGASVVSTWHNLANEVYGPIGIAKAKLSGQELDPDADYFKYGKLRDAARAGVMQDMSPVGQFVYQTLMSAGVDSGINTLIGLGTGLGWASAGLTGLSGFSDMVRTVKERGASDTQALVLGTIEGLAEVVTEKMGFDRIADLLTSKAVSKDLLKKVLANTLSEMGEEGSTTVINQTADWLYGVISGEETEFTQRIDDYMAEGQTESQALGHALLDMAGDVGLDALGGALGGFVLGGASAVTNQALARVDAKLAERGNREARETAQEAAGAPLGADNRTDSRRAETAQAGAQTADARVAALAREAVAEEMQAERAEQAERVARTRGTQEALRQAGEAYGKDAASFERHYTGGDVAQYRRAFDAVYQAGKVNLSMEQVNKTGGELLRGLSEQARQEIWRAGRSSALTTVVPGVSRQYTQAMNSTQRAQLRFLDAVGRKYGIQFDVVDSLSSAGANAALAGRNHIVVAADATDGAYVQAGVHELVHNLQREGGEYYQAFEGMVVEVLKKQDGFDLDAAVSARLREYAEQGVTLTREAALEEVVAEAAPVALTDEAAMRAFVKENRSLAEKIRDFFVRFAKTLREIAAGYGFDNEREEVGVMLKAATQDLVDVAETLDMALSATQERGGAEGAATAQRAQTESTGIELQSLTKYSLKDRNVIEGYLDAVDQEVLEAAQTYREDKNAKFRRIKLGDVQQREAEAIKKLTGKDVSGYTHNIDRNGFVHIENRHGTNGAQDQSMSDLNDVARQGWVIENYDDIGRLKDRNGEYVDSYGYLDANGEPSPVVVYRKRINGTYYLVEAVADGRWKKLWTVSAYISDKKIDASWTSNASLETPNFTSENGSTAASAASVADSEAAVNPSAQISQEQRELSDGETRFSLMSKRELAMFYDKIGEIKIGKDAQFARSHTGEFILAIENKLVYTDGKWRNPQIFCVIELKVGNETVTDLARQSIIDCEKEGYSLAELRGIVESCFGEGSIRITVEGNGWRNAGENGRGEERDFKAVRENDHGNAPAKEGTRFSLKSPVEETKTLVAVHNLSAVKLEKALDLGGMPMPSIAVTKAEIGHSGFGDISLVFGRETVDPKASKANKVYSADAWTPTVPRIEYEADQKAEKRIRSRLNLLYRQVDDMFRADLNQVFYNLSDALTRYGGEKGVVSEAIANYGLKAAYLEEQGRHAEPVQAQEAAEKGYNPANKARYEAVLKALGTRDAAELARTPMIDLYTQHKDALEEAVPGITNSKMRFGNVLRQTIAYLMGSGAPTEYRPRTDPAATRRAIDAAIDRTAYAQWVRELFSGIEGKSGVYNNKERYTPSGNLRSFAATHYPATVDGIVQAMKGQNGGNAKNAITGIGVKSLRAATAESFSSVEAMHRQEGRISALTQDEVDAQTGALNKRLTELLERIAQTKKAEQRVGSFRDYDLAEAIITAEAEKQYTEASVRRALETGGYAVNEQLAGEVKGLLDEIAEMPVTLFEAKPQRAIYFSEAKAAIVPDNLDSELRARLEAEVPTVLTYPDGDEGARLRALNSLEGVRFSLKSTSALNQDTQLLLEGEDVQVDAQSVQAYARDALRAADRADTRINQQVRQAAGKILRDTKSKYDRKTLEGNLREIVAEYAKNGADNLAITYASAELGKAIIEQNTHLDNTLREQYADLRKYLRETGVALTDDQKREAAALYGSYNDFRKALMGTVKITDKRTTLDAQWEELSARYPEIFHEHVNVGDQVAALIDFKEMMQPVYINDYGMDVELAAVDLGLRIQGDALAIAGAKEASRALYGSAAAIEARVKKRYDQQLTAQKKARVAQFQEIASRLAEAKKTGDADGYDAAMTAYRQLIGRETGVRVPTGGGLSESVKMRFSEISERMHTALAADDTAAYKRALTEYKALLKQERIQSTVVAPAVREALGEARARVQANREAREATLGRQKATRRVMKQANDLIDYLANRKKGVRVPRMMQESLLTLLEGLDVNGQNAARRGEETLAAQAVREQLTALRRSYQEIWASQSRGEAPDLLGGLMMTMSEEQYTQLTDALDILDKGGRYTLREMNAEQLNALGDALTTVKRTIATIGRLWRRGRYQSVADLGDASIREMNERPAARYDASDAAGAARDFLALDMLEPVSYGERLGEAGSEIIRGLYDGERVKFTRLREAQEATSGMLERVGVTGYDIGQWRRQVHTVRLGGRAVRLTATQAMDIYLTAQRPQGRGHMLGDGIRLKSTRATGQQVYTVRLQEADLATIEGLLTEKQRAMAREMQAYLAGDVAKWGNDVTQQLYLYDYFTESTYWPLVSDPNVLKTTEPTADRSLTALVQPGFMKPLTKGASNPVIIMDAFDVFSRHVSEMASYNGLALPMTDALGYMNYKQRSEEGELTGSVKESMERLLGSKGGRYLVTLIQDLNHARHGDDLTALSGLTSHYKKAAVTGKIRVVIQQPTAIARAAQEISPVYLLRGLKLGNSADIAEMEAHSALAWWKNNGSGSDIGVGRGADQLLWGDISRAATIEDKISTAGGLIDANRADAVTWAAMWRAVKRETERLHPELTRGSDAYFQAVTERFDAIMDKTQVVDSIMHRSQIMRSQNALAREMTAFQAEPIKSYNMLARSAMELGRKPTSRQAQRTAVRAVLVFAANAALTALAQAAFDVFKHRDDDDTLGGYLLDAQDGFLKEYTDEFLASWLDNMNVIAMIPGFSQAYEILTGGSAPEMMSFEGMGDALQAANTFLDHFGENNKKTTLYGAVAPVLKAASQLTGLPIAGVLANTEMLAKIADPQYLSYRAVSGKYKDNYEALYAAMLKGDTRAAGRIRARLAAETQGSSAKSPKEIDMGVASVLSERDPRIAQAYALRASGQAKQLLALKKQIMADGFSDAIVTAAINRYKPQEEAAPRQKDMNEQLAARLFTYDNLFAAVRGGTLEDVGVIIEALQEGSTAKDPAAAIKSQLSGQFKQEYVDAVSAGRDVVDLKRKLMSAGYTEDELAKWVKSGRYEALKDAVGEADIAGAKRVAQELLDSGADVSSVVSSLNSRYRDVYVELVRSGRTAEAARLQKDLESLGLIKKKTGENYYRKEYMDGWVG